MIYYFDKYFKSNSGIEMYSLSFCTYTLMLFLIGIWAWKINEAILNSTSFATIKTTQKIFFNEGKILMIISWLKTVIKRKLALYSWKQTGNPHRQLSAGQSRVESGSPAVSALKVQLKNSSSLVVPKAPQSRACREGLAESQPRECRSKGSSHFDPLQYIGKKITQLQDPDNLTYFPHPESDVTRKIIPTFSLKQGSPTQAVIINSVLILMNCLAILISPPIALEKHSWNFTGPCIFTHASFCDLDHINHLEFQGKKEIRFIFILLWDFMYVHVYVS